MINEKETLGKEQQLYSYHAFLFPFEWSYPGMKDDLLEDQTDLESLRLSMEKSKEVWERGESWAKPKSLVQFNEVAYFYDFVRPVLYDTLDENTLQLHYYLKKKGRGKREYVIQLKERSYRLNIDDIVVSFFSTGVGVLAFHLLNKEREQSSPNDILKINGLGRRVYPPFLATDMEKLGTQAFFDDTNWLSGLRGVKDSEEIPKSISLEENGVSWVKDDYTSWVVDHDLDREPPLIRGVLPDHLFRIISMKPVLDDRMFVVCYYGNDAVIADVQGQKVEEDFKTNDWWYRYVFVDPGDRTVQNQTMMARLLEETTNARWAGYGTYYGVNRYSFVCLTGQMSNSPFPKIIASHVQTLYYKISLLGLVQRASLLRFSEEVAAISKLRRKDKNVSKRISSLYKQYIRFINRVYFREVTAQEQGIELYDILQQQMRLDKQVKALDREIQELHNYVLILDEDQRNEKLDLLTYFAALFVVPGFITSYYGIGDFKMSGYWWAISLMSAASASLALLIVRSAGRTRLFWIIVTILFSAFVVFGFPLLVDFKK